MSGGARIAMVVVAIVLLAIILRLVGARRLRSKYALLWLTIGLVALPLAAFPSITDEIADALGVADAPALLLLGACLVLLLVCIHFSWELSRLEERTRRLAEEIALLRHEASAGDRPGPDLDQGPSDVTETTP